MLTYVYLSRLQQKTAHSGVIVLFKCSYHKDNNFSAVYVDGYKAPLTFDREVPSKGFSCWTLELHLDVDQEVTSLIGDNFDY